MPALDALILPFLDAWRSDWKIDNVQRACAATLRLLRFEFSKRVSVANPLHHHDAVAERLHYFDEHKTPDDLLAFHYAPELTRGGVSEISEMLAADITRALRSDRNAKQSQASKTWNAVAKHFFGLCLDTAPNEKLVRRVYKLDHHLFSRRFAESVEAMFSEPDLAVEDVAKTLVVPLLAESLFRVLALTAERPILKECPACHALIPTLARNPSLQFCSDRCRHAYKQTDPHFAEKRRLAVRRHRKASRR